MREDSVLNLHATSNTTYTFRLQPLPVKLIGGRLAISWLSYPARFHDEVLQRDGDGGLTSNPCRIAALQANLAFFDFLHSRSTIFTTSSSTKSPTCCWMVLYPLWALKWLPALLVVRYVCRTLGFLKTPSALFL